MRAIAWQYSANADEPVAACARAFSRPISIPARRETRLPPDESRHLTRVLRLGAGAIVVACSTDAATSTWRG